MNFAAKMRIVAWNIRAGGGSRISDIADQIRKRLSAGSGLCE